MVSVVGNLPFCAHRYALFVSYLGTRYAGSQRQVNRNDEGTQNTVQEALEWSLEGVFPKKRCSITSCSRTDKGVHALMNCFSLPLMDYNVPTERVKHIANRRLMKASHEILINQVLLAPATFHPRKMALGREYIYKLAVLKNSSRSLNLSSHSGQPQELMPMLPITELYKVLPLATLNLDKANDVINLLRGEHDFAAFALRPEFEDTVREVEIDLVKREPMVEQLGSSLPYDLYEVHVKSRAFLHNQVRRMVGAIISYSSYNTTSLDTIRDLLTNSENRRWPNELAVAEPYGLYLSKINYHRTTFEGTVRTDENNVQESCFEYPTGLGMSDNPEDLARLCLRALR